MSKTPCRTMSALLCLSALLLAAAPAVAQGKLTLTVQLTGQPLVLTPGQDRLQALKDEQGRVESSLAAKYGATIVGHLYYVLNAVIVQVDATQLQQVASESGVSKVGIVVDRNIDDPATNGLVGATQVQQQRGLMGDGRVVAVLDSGIDFTHGGLGGTGSIADYSLCYSQHDVAPSGLCANFFGGSAPKVIGGFDFVGEIWPNGALAPDPNPIAAAGTGGHGTHVADIISGTTGVAPHSAVVAVKVCSAVSTSCSGTAILEGLDFVGQWNLNPANALRKIDVVNMSLGAAYGTDQDPDVLAIENIVHAGIVASISAGNSGNLPYSVGSPSIARGAISVAQTAMPDDSLFPISVTVNNVATLVKYSVLQTFGPGLTSAISGPVMYGDGSGGNLDGCSAFAAGSLAGKISFVDRGACVVSLKVSNAAAAGAKAVIIGLVAPGDPFAFGFGGGTPTVPSFAINQDSANLIRTATGPVTGSIDPANEIPLVESVVGSSARGLSISYQAIKPEIGTPGGSLSAEAGTGTGQTAFGGTSGAAPVISGSALLIRQQHPAWSPLQIKSVLMNTALTSIKAVDSNGNLYPASTDRIGSGEVRVNRAIDSRTMVSIDGTEGAALSLGYATVGLAPQQIESSVTIANMSGKGRFYLLSISYRDPAMASSGAVVFEFPRSVFVSAHSTQDITIQTRIFGPKLKIWTLNASQTGSSGIPLDGFTFDGYIKVDGGDSQNVVTIPWHTLPHKAADVAVTAVSRKGGSKSLQFSNMYGAIPGTVETFQLLGTRASSGAQPGIGAGQAMIDLKAFGVRDDGNLLQFAVSTYEMQATPNYPAEYDIYIDSTGGQNPNFDLFNAECGLSFAADGRNCSYLINLVTGAVTLVGFTDATYNSGLLIQSVPLALLGIAPGQQVSATALAFDNYYTGNETSFLPSDGNLATYTVGHPRFTLHGSFPAGNNSATFTVNQDFQLSATAGSSSLSTATGLLFLYRDALNPRRESQSVVF